MSDILNCFSQAGALENIIKQSQLEIIELQHSVDELREETRVLKENAEAQAKELMQRKEEVEELKEKDRVANENVSFHFHTYSKLGLEF